MRKLFEGRQGGNGAEGKTQGGSAEGEMVCERLEGGRGCSNYSAITFKGGTKTREGGREGMCE